MSASLSLPPTEKSALGLEHRNAVDAVQDWLDKTLPRQRLDGSASDGGFPEGGTDWCDGRNSAFILASLVAARFWRDRLNVAPARLDEAIVRGAWFIARRQAPDGQMDLNGFYTPNEAGFTLPALAEAYRVLADTGEFRETCALLAEYLQRGAEAVLKGSAFTANHRWAAACAPLSAVHQLWPDARYIEKIHDYLADGIDCDRDGCWYLERSPNYNNVANEGLLIMADNLGDKTLLDHVVRNMEFSIRFLQPNGEADSSFSHRQDRAMRDRPPGSYIAARRAAMHTGDGRFTSLAKHIWRFPEARLSYHIPLPFELARHPGPLPPPRALDHDFEQHLRTPQLLRKRKKATALTLGVDSERHFFNSILSQWGGPKSNDDWFHLHHGNVVIQSIQLAGAGMANIQPATFTRLSDGDYILEGSVPGWTHPLHFRSPECQVHMPWDWDHKIQIHWQEKEIRLKIDSTTPHSLAAALRIWVRCPATVETGKERNALEPGADKWLAGGAPVTILGGGDAMTIDGLPQSVHRFPIGPFQSIPSRMASHCACLNIGLTFPVGLDLLIRLHDSGASAPQAPLPPA